MINLSIGIFFFNLMMAQDERSPKGSPKLLSFILRGWVIETLQSDQRSQNLVGLDLKFKMLREQLLTSCWQDAANSSVTNCSITGLNVHERFAAHSHEHPLLHPQLWNIKHIHKRLLRPLKLFIKQYSR